MTKEQINLLRALLEAEGMCIVAERHFMALVATLGQVKKENAISPNPNITDALKQCFLEIEISADERATREMHAKANEIMSVRDKKRFDRRRDHGRKALPGSGTKTIGGTDAPADMYWYTVVPLS